MPYSAEGYESRAEECVRLANQAADQMIQQMLLQLRQEYLATAARLRGLSGTEERTLSLFGGSL
jgi:hypothetical protein